MLVSEVLDKAADEIEKLGWCQNWWSCNGAICAKAAICRNGREMRVMEGIRRRSKDFECRRCSLCDESPHHWMAECIEPCDSFGEPPDYPREALQVAAEQYDTLWVCKHCDAWMEYMPDDHEEETDLDAAWEGATIFRGK